ncbi:GlmU family protein [Pontibacter sp. SGAir0037]|uniref:GlmU family protein n=1 Tax=Pontibacter sp. SGAir0037 TaxID=2571030 RepID=UPI0010CD60DA|nr:GlmU family protein [Pontibacter sp. SGAir0037]QCR24729.1 glucose-1-phosphate thymidylyltransferase [Pontibacter sp. SGAir0037]
MNIILFDDPEIRPLLLPFTFTRPVAEIRVGIKTITEKWQAYMGAPVSFLTQAYLQKKYQAHTGAHTIYINGAVCPDVNLVRSIRELSAGEAIYQNDTLLAYHAAQPEPISLEELPQLPVKRRHEISGVTIVRELWEIFLFNGQQIRHDFKLVTAGRKSEPIADKHTIVYNEADIFIEEGVTIRAAVLNAENGPIYIGKDAQVMEGAVIRGPFALGESSQVSMGAKIRGDVTVGPFSKVGGEVSASVIFGYTNKGHEGYLGNSVLGEWCNLGADTNTSNLKNNYAEVKIWSHAKGSFRNTGQQFCGLMMGDHSKCGINTMFNTGTVVGVSANIFGAGFPRNFVPSFSWGGAAGFETFQIRKAFEVAEKVFGRRSKDLDEVERAILTEVFNQTQQYRVWEKGLV